MAKIAKVQEVATSKLELCTKPLEWIQEYEGNPRIIDKAVPLVKESIRQVGYITPIVVDEEGVILAGHTRFEALKKLDRKECEVIIVSGLSEEQKKKYRLLDNKTGETAVWDMLKLKSELADVDFNDFDFGQPEIDTKVFDELVEDVSTPMKKIVYCPRCHAEVVK